MFEVDLNCDMGENCGNDALLMPYLSSCSIACGGHVGDENSIIETLLLAKKNSVKVGVHPAYPDPENFGRKSMSISKNELKESLEQQIRLFISCCKKTNSPINHIKPHGALYNDLFLDAVKVDVFLQVVQDLLPEAQLYCAPNSLLGKEAKALNIQVKPEGFMDRAYELNGSLRSRLMDGAILTDLNRVGDQVLSLIKTQTTQTFDGEIIPLEVQTLCLHGDHPEALKVIQYVNQVLISNGIDVL